MRIYLLMYTPNVVRKKKRIGEKRDKTLWLPHHLFHEREENYQCKTKKMLSKKRSPPAPCSLSMASVCPCADVCGHSFSVIRLYFFFLFFSSSFCYYYYYFFFLVFDFCFIFALQNRTLSKKDNALYS